MNIGTKAGVAMAGALTLAGSAAAQTVGQGEGYRGHMLGDGYGMGTGIFGTGMMFLVWGLVILLVVVVVRAIGGQGLAGKGSSALDTLKNRLARGEIDPEEYAARKKALES